MARSIASKTLRYHITRARGLVLPPLGLSQKAALWLCGLMALGFLIASYNTTSLQSSTQAHQTSP